MITKRKRSVKRSKRCYKFNSTFWKREKVLDKQIEEVYTYDLQT